MAENEVLKQALSDFKRSVEITRDVRFEANNRLTQRQKESAYIIAFLSVYVIAISLIPNIFNLEPFQTQLLLTCSIVISVFIIFTSLIDSSQNFYHQGEVLHQCARKIANIHHDLKMVDVDGNPTEAKSQLHELQSSYREILDECPFNHKRVDFYRAIRDKPHLFSERWNEKLFWIRSFYYGLMSFFISRLWLIMPILVIFFVSAFIFQEILVVAPVIHSKPH